VLWNHRWEFDKAPEPFVRAVAQLAAEDLDFRVAVAGEPGDNPSPCLAELPARFPGLVEHFGYLDSRREYGALLWRSDVVVSTARHEFFGTGMVEALYAGCLPVAPARYNYPALVPAELHAACLFKTEAELVDRLRACLVERPPTPPALRESAARFAWAQVAPQWDAALSAAATGGMQGI
jgi:glycosyltransferase involved in cell wall biosynthesis